MVIGISGRLGSGKDTVGKIIQYLKCHSVGDITIQDTLSCSEHDWWLEEQSGLEVKKFAGKLKQIASLLTGIPVEKFEDQEFKKTLLSKEWNSPYNIPFSGPDFVKHDGEMTVREFLQKLGTEAMREGLHTNVWVNALFADYKNVYIGSWGQGNHMYEKPNWIITDMRFPNEMEAVVERKGITIRVTRPDFLSFEAMLHPSETALDDAKFDYEIINDGSLEDLVEKVKHILTIEKII